MATYKNTNGDYIITVNDSAGNLAVFANFLMSGNSATYTLGNSFNITAPVTTISGNLNVVGNLTYIDVQDLRVDDPFITVAGNNLGNIEAATFPNQGLVAQTSADTYAGIRFNNANLAWQISSDTFVSGAPFNNQYSNIATSVGSFLIAAPTNKGNYASPTWTTQGIVAHTSINTYAGLRFNNASSQWEISASVTSDGVPLTPYQAIANVAASTPAAPQNSIQFNFGNAFSGSANLIFDNSTSNFKLTGYQTFGNIGTVPGAVANSALIYHNTVGPGGTGMYVKNIVTNDELVNKSRAIVFGLIL